MRETKQPSSFLHHVYAYLTLLVVAGGVIALDQFTKAWVRETFAFGEGRAPWPDLLPFVRIVNWRNTGAAFGLFQEAGGIFTILAIVVAALIIFYFPRIQRGDWSLRLAMGLQLGGAVGNLIDRLQHGYVTDFVSVSSFPVFNVADTSITFGVLILLFSIWLGGDSDAVEQPAATEQTASE